MQSTYTIQLSDYLLLATTIVSLVALILSIESLKTQRRTPQNEMSLLLSKDFQAIINEMLFLSRVIRSNREVLEILDHVQLDQIGSFDAVEINSMYSRQDLEKIESYFYSTNVIDTNEIINSILIEDVSLEFDQLSKLNREIIYEYYCNRMYSTLNKLDYIALAFNHQIAFDGIVYQALHNAFFEFIRLFYYVIAKSNTSEEENNCFENIITMYNRWKAVANKCQKGTGTPPRLIAKSFKKFSL